MHWADKVATEVKQKGRSLEWVDDMKTPSGRIHVGALMGVVIHDLICKALKDLGVNAKYTYVFENHDPMDDIPSYLPRDKFEPYLGMPLFAIPSPVEGYANYAEYYALEFQKVFNAIGSRPEILWTKDLYTSGKMNDGIRKVLDQSQKIRDIYKELYKKDIPTDWYPFQVYCEQCGKVSTTRVYEWDGEMVHYRCPVDATEWTKGCGYEGKTTPFSSENKIVGKMPWKVEWAVKWSAIGVTVEGAGKDHMSKGGSHDLSSLVAERVLDYPVPYPVAYEWMLIGGKKMSSSKGVGSAAGDMLEILPPELLRFLIVKMDINQQTNFDPSEKDTIPKLFDEYQEYARHYFDDLKDDYARTFELSQIETIKKPPMDVRFSTLAQWVQMPNMEETIRKEGLEEWAPFAKVWLDRFAPESERFVVQETLPEIVQSLTDDQKNYLGRLVDVVDNSSDGESLQVAMYELSKEFTEMSAKDAFKAVYNALLGKGHGPKASALILSIDRDFVKKRFSEASRV